MSKLGFNKSVRLRFLCAICLLFAAFAHQPVVFAGEPLDLSAYALPDGSLPSLCLSNAGENGTVVEVPCEFCRISSSVLLPTELPSSWLKSTQQARETAQIPSTRMAQQLFSPNAPLRGPPRA
ncbi:MAG: hypothetical protein ABJO54_00440 [Hyphomicrobiales bacterium]